MKPRFTMPKPTTVGVIEGLLTIGVLGIVLMSVVGSRSGPESAKPTATQLVRWEAIDRLTGHVLRLPAGLKDFSSGEPVLLDPDRPALMWWINLDSCEACLASVARWNRVASSTSVHSYLVLLSDTAITVPKGLLADTYAMANPTAVEKVFGRLLPSTQMLVAQDGHIVALDSRLSDLSCGWHFSTQIGVLLGLDDPRLIR